MSVEHDKRKRDILKNALDVFVEEGYEGATFQKIADRAHLTRTTLYIYFRSKREIFLSCIKQLTDVLYVDMSRTLCDPSLGAEACLRRVLGQVVDCVAANSRLFSVLLVYLLEIKSEGLDPAERILRRVIRIRHILSTIIIRGMKSGEFRPLVIRDAIDMFYGLIEAATFQLSLGGGEMGKEGHLRPPRPPRYTPSGHSVTLTGRGSEIEVVRRALHLAVDGILMRGADGTGIDGDDSHSRLPVNAPII